MRAAVAADGRHGAHPLGPPETGSAAPDFTLPDTHGTPVQLKALRGAPVLVVFFPFAFSRLCHGELTELSAHAPGLNDAGVHVLGVSCDPMHSLKAWAEQERFPITLLTDFWPHGQVSTAYGVFHDGAGHPGRASVLIDARGTVAWSVLNPPGKPRDIDEHLRAVHQLTARGES